MLEQLTRYFTAASRLRRSERSLVRAGAVMELEQLRSEVRHPKLAGKIGEALNEHLIQKVRSNG